MHTRNLFSRPSAVATKLVKNGPRPTAQRSRQICNDPRFASPPGAAALLLTGMLLMTAGEPGRVHAQTSSPPGASGPGAGSHGGSSGNTGGSAQFQPPGSASGAGHGSAGNSGGSSQGQPPGGMAAGHGSAGNAGGSPPYPGDYDAGYEMGPGYGDAIPGGMPPNGMSPNGMSPNGASLGSGAAGSLLGLPDVGSILSGLQGSPLGTPPPQGGLSTGPVLKHDAEQAMAAGDLPRALQLYFGHMVAEYDQAAEELDAVRYSPLLKRPVWLVRWGVSMKVRGDQSVSDYQPIVAGGSDRNDGYGTQGYGQRGAGGYGSAGGSNTPPGYPNATSPESAGSGEYANPTSGYPGSANPAPGGSAASNAASDTMLDQGTRQRLEAVLGLVATEVEEAFASRYRDGDFGEALTSVSPPETETDAGGGQGPDRGNGPSVPGSSQTAPYGQANPYEEMSPYEEANQYGPTAPSGADYAANAPNAAGSSAGSASAAGPGPAHAGPAAAAPPPPASNSFSPNRELPIWTPGVVSLGEGSSEEIVRKARQHEIDLLIHFDVVIEEKNDEQVDNLSRCRVIHVASGKTLAATKSFENDEVARLVEAERTTEEEYVEERLGEFMEIVDEKVKIVELPQLTSDIARRRVTSLISGNEAERLRTLAEIRLYQHRGLLTTEEVEQAFDIVGRDDTLVMLYGREEERLRVARQWTEK